MKKGIKRFRKGAASFYIVAFSTLILMIIAMSFAAVIISEVTRTSNDDLSQSAYDSALAGVEDAKIAFANYQNCKLLGAAAEKPGNLNNLSGLTCGNIVWLMEESNKDSSFNDCDMVSAMLGRAVGGDSGTEIKESNTSNNMSQFYTCAKIRNHLENYVGSTSASNPIVVVRPKFGNLSADSIDSVTIRWFSDKDYEGSNYNFNNISDGSDAKVVFPSLTGMVTPPMPPTVSLTVVQTGTEFSLDDFEKTSGDNTDRGTVYMVPYNSIKSNAVVNGNNKTDNRNVATYNSNTGINSIGLDALKKSNDKVNKNLPYAVRCEDGPSSGKNYACSVNIKLPKPIGGTRSDETFMIVVATPYGKPKMEFSLEFYCGDGATCSKHEDSTGAETNSSLAILEGVQIEVDSTGRANDLYRRVRARLESSDASALSIMGPLELSGDGGTALQKNYYSTKEYNF